MSGPAELEAFAAALAAGEGRRAAAAPAAPAAPGRVAVLGGGEDARLIAALALAAGAETTLFTAYGAERAALAAGVALRGAGPVGTYQAGPAEAPAAAPRIALTGDLDAAAAGADALFLTGPIRKQRTYAMALAEHLRDGQILVLAPGRTLGALEAAWLLRAGGAAADVTLVEAQGLPFHWRAEGAALHLSPAGATAAATLPSGREAAIAALAAILPGLEARPSVVHSGFADGSGLVEAPALLIGGPAAPGARPAPPPGGVPLAATDTFRNLIGPVQAEIAARLAEEREAVAARFGVRGLPGLSGWLDRHAGAAHADPLGGAGEGSAAAPGARPVPGPAEARAILRDAVLGSLVPLASAGAVAGVPTPATDAAVALASAALGADVAGAGRRLAAMGLGDAAGVEDARRRMDRIAGGGRG